MPSVTFHPCVISTNRHKDGTYPVKIRVTFKGVSRRLPTNLSAGPGDLTRSLRIKSPDLLNKTAALVNEMRATLADLSPFALEDWDVDKVVAHIRRELTGQSFRLDFFAFADRYLQCKEPGTCRAYTTALNSLAAYLGKRELDINDITKALLLKWRDAVDARSKVDFKGRETGRPQRGGQSSRMLAKLSHIYTAAKREYNDDDRVLIPRSPFDGIPKPVPPPDGARPFSLEEMQLAIDAEAEGVERIALDVFVVSFATMGANLADLYAAKPCGPEWVYNRRKTEKKRQDRARMEVSVPPEIAPQIARLQDGPDGWWLPALHRLATTSEICTSKVNAALKTWAARVGLPDVEHVRFYSSRKAWATMARSIGVEKALVDECLTHVGDFPVTDIYARRDYSRMNEANRKVLALLDWHDSGPTAIYIRQKDEILSD